MPNSNAESRKERLSAEAQFFQNPWSDATQKVRDRILLVSVVGVLMAGAGIFPKEITAIGLKVDDINQRALLIVWAVVVAYLAITLAFSAYSDFMRGYWGELHKLEVITQPADEIARQLFLEVERARSRLKDIHLIRLLVDMLIPLSAGITAFVLLLWKCSRI